MRSIVLLAVVGLVLCLVSMGSGVAAFQSPVPTPIIPTATVLPSPTGPAGRIAQLQPLAVFSGDIVRSAAALATVIIALVGLNKWRAELRGRTKLEIARRMVKLAYKFKDQFEYARNVFTRPGESADRIRDPSEDTDTALILDEYYARGARIDALRETALGLREASWEAEIVFEQDIREEVARMEEAYTKLATAVQTLFNLRLFDARESLRRPPPRSRDDMTEGAGDIVYGTTTDEVSQSVSAAVATLVEKLGHEIRR